MTSTDLKNDSLLRACKGELVRPHPIWIMRQSGRYMPEYLEMKSKFKSFTSMIRDPKTCAELAMLPLRRYKGLIDAAILFTDILVVLVPIGFKFEMIPSKGIIFENLITKVEDVNKLNFGFDVKKELAYVFEAVSETHKRLDGEVPLIGFSGSPFTLFCYMIEGGSTQSSSSFSRTKTFMYNHPKETHFILEKLSEKIAEYLGEQVKKGVQIIQIFDTNAGILSPEDFNEFCVKYYKTIICQFKEDNLNKEIPLILFAKGNHDIDILENLGFDVLSIDWTVKIPKDKKLKVAIQGNLDPCILFGPKELIAERTSKMLDSFNFETPVIVNLGHGMLPNHDPEHLKHYLEAVKNYTNPNKI